MPFNQEGPQFYQQAYAQNKSFAKPSPSFIPYQTQLNPVQELAFRGWLQHYRVPFDPNAQVVDYDMRGYFNKIAGAPHPPGQHFPDEFKTPYDTSFSRESRYATPSNPFVWHGNNLIDRRNNSIIFGGSNAAA